MQNDFKISLAFCLSLDKSSHTRQPTVGSIYSLCFLCERKDVGLSGIKSDVSFSGIVRWQSTSNVLSRFDDLQKLKPCFAIIVNPFMVDVVNDGCSILAPLAMESSAVEMELMELQEDLGLKMIHKSQSTIEFWKQVPEIKYPKPTKTLVTHLNFQYNILL
ncbi:Hypothetical predicted protein [Octopus vulgaris]|uniref:Uncharacterized protein n=1 Tax=Octopus vulgaris TaxID=6645 RepID=A0AA36BLL0_OCTVU|nr:Hypothetical predicted protein [Octopus vulgaris]